MPKRMLAAAVIGILVIIGGSYWLMRGIGTPKPVAETASTTPEAVDIQAPLLAQPAVYTPIGTGVVRNSSGVYYRSSTSAAGEPVYTKIQTSHPENFKKIGSANSYNSTANQRQVTASGTANATSSTYIPLLGENAPGNPSVAQSGSSVQQLGSSSGASYTTTYYTDGQSVYVVAENGTASSGPQSVPDANPDTFEVINSEYAKDDEHVYVVSGSCSGSSCSVSVSIVQGADPDSFQAYASAQTVSNSDCTGYVTADAQTNQYLFNNGKIVDGISIYLIGTGGECSQEPVLVSP